MKIPYSRQSINAQDIREVCNVLKSPFITQGPAVKQFEEAVARYCGAKFAVAVNSGTSALHIAALAAGVGKDDEIITSPITFLASANCAVFCGAHPVFADIDPKTINIDPKEIARKITKKTKAIIPVHFGGQVCDMPKIKAIARRQKITIIEDASHALGADYLMDGKWGKVGDGRYSDMTVFSFHPVKSITTAEGGMVVTNDPELYRQLLIFRNHGMVRDPEQFVNQQQSRDGEANGAPGGWYYEMQTLGFNYRLSDLHAALGLSQLSRLDQFIAKRRRLAARYTKAFARYEEIGVQAQRDFQQSAWHLYLVRVGKGQVTRKTLFTSLQKEGIGVQVHYIPVHLQPFYFKKYGYKRGDFPNAEAYYDSVLSIPLFPTLTTKEQDQIIATILSILKIKS